MKKVIDKIKDNGGGKLSFIWLLMWSGFMFIVLQQMYIILKFNVISPLEIREGVGFKYAKEFAQGHNPYGLNVLSNEASPVINHYGFVMPLFLSLFIRFFPDHMVFIVRLVTFIVRLFGCYCFYKGIEIKTNKKWLSILSVFFIYVLYQYSSYPCTWALTFSFLLYWIISSDGKTGKSRIHLYILIVIALFYTKQYFVLLSLGVFVYLLFCRRKKQAIKFMLFGAGSGIISALIVNLIFPLYFTQAFLFVGVTSSTSNSVPHMKGQFENMIYRFFSGFFILLIPAVLIIIYTWYKIDKKKNKLGGGI